MDFRSNVALGRFCYNLVTQMQNLVQKFRQCSIVFEKPGILSENLKTLMSFDYPTVQCFFAEKWVYLQMGVWNFFYFV